MRIVQVASPYGNEGGGLRAALDGLARGYVAAGHERVLVVPGASSSDRTRSSTGRCITVSGRHVRSTGQHVVGSRPGLVAVLERVKPDRLEVSDDRTLSFLGTWAHRLGIPSVALVHERRSATSSRFFRSPSQVADAWDRWHLGRFDRTVCTSWFVREELDRIGATNVSTVPLGVDLERFSPHAGSPSSGRSLDVVCVGRLSRDKRPELAIEALRLLVASGVDARLTMVGGGPLRSALERRARWLPVTFTGHVVRREELAAMLASADVAVTPCPVEGFSFAVLEAMACGTPVVVPARGPGCELVVPDAGVAVGPTVVDLAQGVLDARSICRDATRRRAEQFPWSSTIDAMLRIHGDTPVSRATSEAQAVGDALTTASRSSSGT